MSNIPSHQVPDAKKGMHNVLRLPQVRVMTGMTRSLIYLYMEKNDFPIPIKIGDWAVGWIESEIQEWIDMRMKARPVRET